MNTKLFTNELGTGARIPNERLPLFTMGLAAFAVFGIANLFSKGLAALGWNVTLFLGVFTYVAFLYGKREGEDWKKRLRNFIPLFLIALSFSVFENPFIKAVHFLAFPVGMFLVTSGALERELSIGQVLFIPLETFFRPVFRPLQALSLHFQSVLKIRRREENFETAAKVVKGILILVMLLVVVVIPLLSGADSEFAYIVESFWTTFCLPVVDFLFDSSIFVRAFFFVILTLLMVASLLGWERSFAPGTRLAKVSSLDPIVTTIVLGGVLLSYCTFLMLQGYRLWHSTLPTSFYETEWLVKQGFWQLLFLTAFNIGVFVSVHRRSTRLVQVLLGVFTGAAVLLLLSAAHRLGLYVFYYGLSYEKWYACFVVLYCVLVYGVLFRALAETTRSDIVRTCLHVLVWMYSASTLFPVEYSIFATNLHLRRHSDSRIDINDMRMLSLDAVPVVAKNLLFLCHGMSDCTEHKRCSRLGKDVVIPIPSEESGPRSPLWWNGWIERQQLTMRKKSWYEETLSSLYARTRDLDYKRLGRASCLSGEAPAK